VATPEQISPSAFARQLNFIAQDLSSLRQDLKGLAAHQEQLATAQASLMAAQEQTLLKLGAVDQLKHGSPTRRAYR
jgi:prefoldin subunit 5